MELYLYILATALLFVMAVALAGLLARRATMSALSALIVCLGLVYDNSVIAAGGLIGFGPALEALNWPRFVIHAFATPLLIVFAAGSAERAGLEWARRPVVRGVFWLLTLALIAYGVVFELLPTTLEPSSEGGVLRYTSARETGVPVPALGTLLVLVGIGLALWRSRDWPGLALGSFASGVGFALGPVVSLGVVGQLAEVVLIGGIVFTEWWLQQRERPLAAAAA